MLLAPSAGLAYSVLSHEEVVDLAWDKQLKPVLLARFPKATAEELRDAHAYAYGGCMIQDIGYYPFGNKMFSNLSHYVRSGDFVMALISEASNLNEYAFALGALAHYASDVTGHPVINASVAREYPKLRAKYGSSVTYADDPTAHIRIEFGFDVEQVARNRYTSDAYHDFIGFQVAKPVLERAFLKTYGIELNEIFADIDLSIGTFRRAIGKVIPEMTRVALVKKEDEITREQPTITRRTFLYRLNRTEYEREWGDKYRRPGLGARIIAAILSIVPKIGPFKALAVKMPTPETENQYLKSMNDTADRYGAYLRQARSGSLHLPNMDFDTGNPTRPGEYPLTDDTYAKLLDKLASDHFANLSAALRRNILEFYADPDAAIATRTDADDWQKVEANLRTLKASPSGASATGTDQ